MLAFPSFDVPAYPARAPRHAFGATARFRCAGLQHRVRLVDLSLQGAKMEFSGAAAIDQIGLLAFAGLSEPLLGNVRWVANGRLGFRFSTAMPSDVLECVLRYAARDGATSV